MICPSCKGKKVTLCLVDGPNYSGPAELACSRCRGAGEVDPDMERWMKIGGIHRTWRIAQWESLRDCAKRLKIDTSELSAMEQGRKDPTWLIPHIPIELQPNL